MRAFESINALARALVRKRRPVIFGDLRRPDPVSRDLGWSRGTPIDRRYIQQYLSDARDDLRGDALEVGELRYIDEFGTSGTNGTILVPDAALASNYPQSTRVLVGDLSKPGSLPEGRFDCFVCTQTLNFIFDTRNAIVGAHRVLKKGGCFLGTVSGHCVPVSRYDADLWGDFWRFSATAVTRLLKDVFQTAPDVRSYGNALAAQVFIQGIAVEDLPNPSLLDMADADHPLIIGFRVIK